VRGKVFLAATLLALCATARAQEPGGEAEREAVKRVVETYLFAEYDDEKKSLLHPKATIFTADEGGNVRSTPMLKSKARKVKGAKTARSPQKLVSVEVEGNAAYVKVATDFSPEGPPGAPPEHVQLISLMKLGDEWKILFILMPSVVKPGR
jgi:hypothetical protein